MCPILSRNFFHVIRSDDTVLTVSVRRELAVANLQRKISIVAVHQVEIFGVTQTRKEQKLRSDFLKTVLIIPAIDYIDFNENRPSSAL